MIKAVTYQGNSEFNANLYALEIKSRFIDQSHADGYYVGYGSELDAKIVGNQIQIGTGAFVVQGRMNEVVSAETVSPAIYNNFVGYVVARIETYHTADADNCIFKAYVNTALSEIPLQQDDVYAMDADNINKVYELPIYSFEIKNGAITNLQKLIQPVDDYARVQAQIAQIQEATNKAFETIMLEKDEAVRIADDAKTKAENAEQTASSAETKAENATRTASNAVSKATQAYSIATTAQESAQNTIEVVNNQHADMTAEINALAQQIGERQGTTIIKDGVALNNINADELTAKIQVRKDTAENWKSENPILDVGEIGYDITNKNTKIGDGITRWKDLGYFKVVDPPSFSNDSLEQIVAHIELGDFIEVYSVGDEKVIELSTGEQITVVILGFNHDNLSDGSGKASISIGMKNLLTTKYVMDTNYTTNYEGWGPSSMRTGVMETLFSQLPNEWQSIIKTVKKKYSKALAGGLKQYYEIDDKLWLLSSSEVFGIYSEQEGAQYEYWKKNPTSIGENCIKRLSNGSGIASGWWLRTINPSFTNMYEQVDENGQRYLYGRLSTASGVSFCFCI